MLGFGRSPSRPVCSLVPPGDTTATVAVALLAEVEAAGAALRVRDGKLVATGARLPAPLVGRLLAHKAAVLTLLAPHATGAKAVDPGRCRYCGGRMPDLRVRPPAVPSPRAWRDAAAEAPGAVAFADGSAAHRRCYEAGDTPDIRHGPAPEAVRSAQPR
jgi:hypothetical protein